MKKVFITTSIPYVNGAPHIGHALELVQADTMARAFRLADYDVYFLTGTDENAQKNVESAEKQGIPVQELVDVNSKRFSDLKPILNLSNDGFIRTTSNQHRTGAQAFWNACKQDIYKKTYTGWYCVGCEAFYLEGEFPNNICPDHDRPLERVSEENYFFKLSHYRSQIREVIATDMLRIAPSYRKQELLNFIDKGLEDFSISRPVTRMKGWGIPVPGDSTQNMYVWFDALTNYITGLHYGTDEGLFNTYWSDNPKRIHILGKDIMKFHAIYWIGMLLSAKILLPTHEYIHGFFTIDGHKMSKTLGNVVSPEQLVDEYGTDAVRYYLLKEIPSLSDGDFSHARMRQLYDADLANELGNLMSRVTTLAATDGITVESEKEEKSLKELTTHARHFEFHLGLELLWKQIKDMNKAINEHEPWKLKSEARKELLLNWLHELNTIGVCLMPYMPNTGDKLIASTTGTIQKMAPLFPRIKPRD